MTLLHARNVIGMTVREINRAIRIGKPVVALYEEETVVVQGRIIRARLQHGIIEGKRIDGPWVRLIQAWEA